MERNIHIVGISHAQTGQVLSDHSMNALIDLFNGLRPQSNVLLILEGAYIGLIRGQDPRFLPATCQIHPLLSITILHLNTDLLFKDPRRKEDHTREAYEKEAREISLLQQQLILHTDVSNIEELEKVVFEDRVSWSAKDYDKSIARNLNQNFSQADQAFIAQALEYSSNYDQVIIVVGAAHYLNIKKENPNKFTYVLPGLVTEKKLNFLLKGYTVFYLMGATK